MLISTIPLFLKSVGGGKLALTPPLLSTNKLFLIALYTSKEREYRRRSITIVHFQIGMSKEIWFLWNILYQWLSDIDILHRKIRTYAVLFIRKIEISIYYYYFSVQTDGTIAEVHSIIEILTVRQMHLTKKDIITNVNIETSMVQNHQSGETQELPSTILFTICWLFSRIGFTL